MRISHKMLSKTTDVPAPTLARTIFINPNFRQPTQSLLNDVVTTAHFNPLFLQKRTPPSIHMNPQFFQQKMLEQQLLLKQQELEKESVKQSPRNTQTVSQRSDMLGREDLILPLENRKIITKSRTKLVREPLAVTSSGSKPLEIGKPTIQPLISLNKRKLIRRPTTTTSVVTPSGTTTLKQPADITKFNISSAKYKVDHRIFRPKSICSSSVPLLKTKRRDFVARYALRRVANQVVTKEINGSSSVSSLKPLLLSANRKLRLLNINGVLYKSTGNKLQRKDAANHSSATIKSKPKAIQKLPTGRTLFVRGTKFVMDAQGYRLTRMPNSTLTKGTTSTIPVPLQRQRIDIGGLTYIASKTQNVFVRTSNHLALAHVNTAKHRSVQMLSKRFVKSNVPCAIFQRVGKCVAYDRGRCNKVHDKRQVTICPKFLRSECHNSNCLLSHNASLSKMPVCKFFLQGLCVRQDCPYLHKKLSQSVGICEDFLHGYCKLAEQCTKRHEFLCPEFERNGKCELTNCMHCKSKKRQQKRSEVANKRARKELVVAQQSPQKTDVGTARYFVGNNAPFVEAPSTDYKADESIESDSDVEILDETVSNNAHKRRQIGALPSFIPLS